MTAAKAAAAQRGIPEAKVPVVAKTDAKKSGGRTRGTLPIQALPKGGR
jgi:hypothetical protein